MEKKYAKEKAVGRMDCLREAVKVLRRWMDLSSLRRRITLSFLAVSLLPIALLLVFTRNSTSQLFLEDYATTLQASVSDFSRLAGAYFTRVRRLSSPIYGNETYINLLQGKVGGLDERNRLNSSAQMIVINNPEILRLNLYTRYDRSIWFAERQSGLVRQLIGTEPSIEYVPGESPVYELLPMQTGDEYNERQTVFQSRQVITDIPRKNMLAVLTIDFSALALDELLEDAAMYPNEALFLIDEQNRLLYRSGQTHFLPSELPGFLEGVELHMTEPVRRSYGGQDYLVFARALENQPVYALRVVPYSDLTRRAGNAIDRTVWLYALLAMVAVGVGLVLSARVTRPLNVLVRSMKRVGRGEFGEHIEESVGDAEIQMLFERFNRMTDQINQLFRETYQLRLAQQTAELKALQSQINPHFLYNTLQTVHYMALMRNAYEINLIVDSLSSILKYCLNNKSDVVMLDQELSMVNQYLTIQQVRFMDKLSVVMDVQDESRRFKIPKMTLQPLVENSIQHGIQDSDVFCTVRVVCRLRDGMFEIEVSDDGLGMDEPRLRQVRASLHDTVDSLLMGKHIGLRNCWMRLKFFFKDAVEMMVDSAPEQGTTVRIRIRTCRARKALMPRAHMARYRNAQGSIPLDEVDKS